MSFHGQIHVSDVEEQLCERMAVQERRVQSGEEAEAQRLPHACVFCGQGESRLVEVVLLVEEVVEPAHLVMQQMPQEVLHVEQEEARHHILHNSQHLRSQPRRNCRSHVPVHNRQWENEKDVVVENIAQAAPSHWPCHSDLRLDLEAAYEAESGTK